MGLVSHENNNNQSWRLKMLQKAYSYFVYISLTYFMCTVMVSMIQNVSNLGLFTELLSTFGYGFLAIIRMVSINSARKEFGDLMETLEELFPKTRVDQRAFETRTYYMNFRLMRRLVSGFIMSGGIIFLVGPLSKLILTGTWINKLPFPNWYPFDPYDPRIYNFVLLSQMHHIVCINASLVGPDMMLYAFCTLISMEFDILCNCIKGLEDEKSPQNANQILKSFIERHKTLIRLSENLEKIFSVLIFFNFFEGSLFICMYGYQITISTTLTDFVQYTNLLLVTLVQVFMICYYGNKLTIASEKVAQAAFESGWQHRTYDQENKNLIMILLRSQKPIVLTAYKFAVVFLQVYSTVSAVSILKFEYLLI